MEGSPRPRDHRSDGARRPRVARRRGEPVGVRANRRRAPRRDDAGRVHRHRRSRPRRRRRRRGLVARVAAPRVAAGARAAARVARFIAANEARRLGRERRRRNVVEIDIETQGELSGGGDHGRRTAGDLDLVNALNRLSAEDRALLALRYVAGLDSLKLARATGRSASGTRARLGRLLARLRTELSDD